MPSTPAEPVPARVSGEPVFVSTAEVARRKGCTGMAVRNAVKRGDLNAVKVGPVWVVADDAALAAWAVRDTGGRAHRVKGAASPTVPDPC